MKLASRGGRDAGSITQIRFRDKDHKKQFHATAQRHSVFRCAVAPLREKSSVPFCRIVLRQRLDDKVESEPQTPAVMVKKYWKYQRHHEQQDQHVAVVSTHNQQEKETDHEDHELRRDHIREDGAHEKPVFTLEQRQTVRAVVPDMKRVGRDRRLPTRRTTQSQTTP